MSKDLWNIAIISTNMITYSVNGIIGNIWSGLLQE